MQRSYINDSQLPLVIEPEGGNTYTCSKSSLHDFLTAERGSLETDLTKHGAILFRGFDLLSPEDFSDVFDRFLGDKKAKSYRSGGGNKSKVLRNVYTSTEHPARYRLAQHNEMSYTKSPPRYISFFCEMPPQVGGETPLACSRKMFERMPEDIKDQFQENDGVKYVRFNLPQIRLFKPKKGNVAFSTWQSVFETDEAEEVEEICRREGLRVEWYRFGGLRTTLQLPAIREHPVTGEKTWFNQVHVFLPTRRFLSLSKYVAYRSAKALLYPKRFTFACFGNNKPIPTRTVDEINDVIDSLMVKFRWEKSDFLLIDNLNTSHGRMPYRGPRRILTAMS